MLRAGFTEVFARASLLSTTTGVVRITATVDGTTADTSAQFTTSLPDRLHVSLDAAELKYFRTGRVVVLYVGSSGQVLSLLGTLLGPQFAGR